MVASEGFNKRLKLVAKLRKKYQADIVRDLKKTRSAVSDWFNGNIVPHERNIQMLADYFKCSFDWLAFNEGEMFPDDPAPSGEEKGLLDRFKKLEQAHSALHEEYVVVQKENRTLREQIESLEREVQTLKDQISSLLGENQKCGTSSGCGHDVVFPEGVGGAPTKITAAHSQPPGTK